jgi:general stress protein CsbA
MSGAAATGVIGGAEGAEPRRESWWAWIVVALIVAAVAMIRVRLLDVPLDRDEGEYAYFGQLLLQGVAPYASAYNFKLPGIYVVYATILAALGQTPAAVHVGLLIANAISIVLMFLVARRLIGTLGGVASSATYAALALSPRLFSPSAYAEHFVLVPVLLGMLVLTRSRRPERLMTAFGAGTLFGVAFLVKQSGGAFALYGLLSVLAASSDSRRRTTVGAVFMAGTLAPYAMLCLFMLFTGAFGSFWFWTVTYAYYYGTGEPVARGASNLWAALGSILPTCYLAAALSALGFAAGVWDRPARARFAPIGMLLLCGLIATSAGLYFRNQYFILLLPAVALLAGVAVDALTRHLAVGGNPVRRAVVAIACTVVPLLHLVYLERAILFTATPRQVARALYGMNPFPEAIEIGRYLKDRTSAGDRIAIVGSEPEIYFYSQRRGATGYVYTYALMEPQPYAVSMQREMIREIETGEPRFVIFVRVWTSWLMRPESDQTIFRWFDEYQKGFERVGVVDMLSPGQTRYLWGEAAAAYTPVTDRWIAVYERRGAAAANERTRP